MGGSGLWRGNGGWGILSCLFINQTNDWVTDWDVICRIIKERLNKWQRETASGPFPSFFSFFRESLENLKLSVIYEQHPSPLI